MAKGLVAILAEGQGVADKHGVPRSPFAPRYPVGHFKNLVEEHEFIGSRLSADSLTPIPLIKSQRKPRPPA